MNKKNTKEIVEGNISLGIELGSTRIKAILINSDYKVIAQGDYAWENKLIDGYWTYGIDEVFSGIKSCYRNLKLNVENQYGVVITKIKNMGISAMMHGYLVLDENDNLLVPFRTWRNSNQEEASKSLSQLYNFPMPQRFSNTHIYQAILNKEAHINDIKYQTTLSGYIHYCLTGEKVLGIGEASGMFPIDIETKDFNQKFLKQFNNLVHLKGITWNYQDILPQVKLAGEKAGHLTKKGAYLLDPTGDLKAGSQLCPPEGDAATGMVATNSVAVKTGNVSAGTSVFAMIVLEDNLKKLHPEIDLVTTPTGNLVGMVHCNNCTSNLNRWMDLFDELITTFGFEVSKNDLYTKLFNHALSSDLDAGGLLSYEYLSGEHITGFKQGRPLFAMTADSNFNLANFLRCSLYSSLGALKIGVDILLKEEGVNLDKIYGHGGFFKTAQVGQKVMSQAMNTPVAIMDNAGEGGAFGIAILASFLDSKKSLDDFLKDDVFKDAAEATIMASKEEINGFEQFIKRYRQGLAIERSAIDNLN